MTRIPVFVKMLLIVFTTILLALIIINGITDSYFILAIQLTVLLGGIVSIIVIKKIPLAIKIIVPLILILFMGWLSIITIDLHYMYESKQPVFAKETSRADDIHTYEGLGYKIELEYGIGMVGNETTEKRIIGGTMSLFDKIIGAIVE